MRVEMPSRSVLESLPERALRFLNGAGTVPAIRAILANYGYTDEEHKTGWDLLHKVSGYSVTPENFGVQTDGEVRRAITALDEWDEPNFARAQAALDRRFPSQAAFLFHNLEPAQGVAAVMSVRTFLERLDALESGKDRKSTHKEDLAALALLEQRGITKAVRQQLAEHVKVAERGTVAQAAPPTDTTRAEQHQKTLLDLHGWYKDWSTVAHTEIRRRDYLIRLGLAKRQSRAGDDAQSEPESTPVNSVG